LEGGLDITSVEASSALDPKAFYRYIVGVLPLSIGVDLIFKGIMDCSKIKPAILLRGLVKI